MDWGRAKSILIVVFLVLNIFLAANLIMDRWVPAISNKQLEIAEGILSQRGITLNTKIPKNSEKATRLPFEGIAQFDMQSVASKLLGTNVVIDREKSTFINGNKQISIENKFTFLYTNKSPQDEIDIDNDKNLEKLCRDYLKSVGFQINDLVLDYFNVNNSSEKSLIFVQRKGSYKLFDNKIEMLVSSNGIKSIRCILQKISTQKHDTEYIMPAYKVLVGNLWQSEGLVILGIDLGYTIDTVDGEMTGYYERLHWRVKTNKGETFFDAVTGKPKNI